MVGRHLEGAPLPEQDRAVDNVGLVGRQLGQLQVDLAGAQRAEPVGQHPFHGLHRLRVLPTAVADRRESYDAAGAH
jgi:hypothetical protein